MFFVVNALRQFNYLDAGTNVRDGMNITNGMSREEIAKDKLEVYSTNKQMKYLLLFLGAILGIALVLFFLDLWYKIFIVGQLYKTVDVFQSVLYCSAPILLVIGLIFGVKKVYEKIS